MSKKIAFITLGCKLNYAETSSYERHLVKAGFEVVHWNTAKADIYLVNTCTVTEQADKKSRNIIRKLHRLSPEAMIVVCGCSAELRRENIANIEGVKYVFGANEKSKVVPSILKEFDIGNSPEISKLSSFDQNANNCSELSDSFLSVETYFPAYSSGERTRSFLKVQDGCDFKCAYCTVPYARGESRNAPISTIIAQVREIAAEGIKEVVLTGVNTGDFGKSTGESFFDLIKELNEVEGIERLRISSIEPNLLTEEMIDWIASGTKFLPHFHIPLQSGSDTILREMRRRYTTVDFAHKIDYIREKMGDKVFFGIDVIVGFPGETDELFMETYNFLKNRIRPTFIHIFPYSRRSGTLAAERKDQVQDIKKTERVRMLKDLSDKLNKEFIAANKGRKEKVLFESTNRKGHMEGYTSNYIRISRAFDPELIGKIVEVVI